ncbi:hypothetical protein CEP52_008575 [Neofusicoccum parvum]|nr:hypothetical protein CEP52_008575 [Neofusicoccum parvum]
MPTILIVGATGQQGGGVVNALLATGRIDLSLRALTRNPSSASATALSARGVQPVKGDLLDRASVAQALKDCDAAYLVTDFRGREDVDGELKQGRQFVDAAKELGLAHLVFSSVAGADIATAVDHFHTKYQIEEHIRAAGLPHWTAIRPVGFMEVVPPPGIGRFFFWGAMAALMGATKQKYVACDDIGKAVAKALLNPADFNGKVVTVAGQVADVDELQEAVERGEGRRGPGRGWRAWFPRWFLIWLTPHHYKQMFDWLYYENCQPGSPEETRAIVGDTLDLETWARRRQAQRELRLSK